MIRNMFGLIFASLLFTSCTTDNIKDAETLAPTDPLAKAHWYDGKAEISSYKLQQARYGEMHEGQSVMIFVTEDYSKKSWTKADNPGKDDIPVLKLNMTKKFNTGIYPYSMMLSTFFPFNEGKHAVKISASMQEWCGHTYMELRNKKQFEVRVDSYFEGESVEELKLEKTYLEDDFWSMIRLNPANLPVGNAKVIPSFFYVRLSHVDLKAYDCKMTIQPNGESTEYGLDFPDLERTVSITYETAFPHQIQGWSETYYSGWGDSRQELTTTAELMKSIRVDYWSKNTLADSTYRTILGLD